MSNISKPEKLSLGIDEFKRRSIVKHGDKYDYSDSIYVNLHKKITIKCLTHGDFTVKSRGHLDGAGCKKCEKDEALKLGYHRRSNRFGFDKFLSLAVKSHGDKYTYYQETYVKMKDKIKINCKDHGDFWQQASKHVGGHNCPKCSTEKTRIKHCEFLLRSRDIHGNRYDYSKSIFSINRDMVLITCKTHGDFKQKVSTHLSGHGCKKCEMIGFRRSTFVERCKEKTNNQAKLYLIKCNLNDECFFKVGITRASVKSRFRNLPYSYDILSVIEGDAGFIWDKEHDIHRKLGAFHYEPVIAFGGHKLECFSELTLGVLEFFGVNNDSIT